MPNTEASRIRDRIDTGPRFSETDAVRLNRLFRGTDTTEMLETTKTCLLGWSRSISFKIHCESDPGALHVLPECSFLNAS